MFSENKLLKNILRTGIVSACLCLVLFLCAYIFLGKIQLNSFSLAGSLVTLLTTLVISFLWLVCYWLLDSIKHEPLSNVASAFLAGFFVQFALQTVFNRFLISSMFASGNFRALFFVKDAFIAALSFYTAFWLYVGRLREFDEEVDNLIYGGFTGIGIAAAICLNQFYNIPSLNMQFVVVILLTRIALCSSLCALAGILSTKAKKNWQLALSALVIPAIYYLESLIHLLLRKNLSVSQHKIQELLIPLIFVLVLFALIVFIILRTAAKNKENEENYKFPVKKMGLVSAVLLVISICLVCLIQLDSNRGIKITSENAKISLKIPASFEKNKQTLSIESLFENSEASKQSFTKKRTEFSDQILMDIDFSPFIPENFALQELPFSPVNGCKIYELPKNPAVNNPFFARNLSGEEGLRERDAYGKAKGDKFGEKFAEKSGEKLFEMFAEKSPEKNPEKMPDYVVILKKGDATVGLEFTTSRQNRPYVHNVVKMIAKSLSAEDVK
ncbi:MAG: hypothetical protein K6E78_05045 [Treponema sp.]|nr:hypothetical protein [Treponema sp.]